MTRTAGNRRSDHEAAHRPLPLTAGGHDVGRYGWDAPAPPQAVVRPVAHPLRAPGGALLTGTHPADHPWHSGLGLALPDVNGVNLWGGPTYVRDHGYRPGELGTVREAAPARQDGDTLGHDLLWCDGSGRELLHETRRIRVGAGPGGAWSLEWSSELTTAGDRAVALGSPGSNGRTGAGYGGFFWRLPPLSADRVTVFTARQAGEEAVNGSRADWLALAVDDGAASWTAVLAGTDPRTRQDPWFVRVAEYAGIGSALAWSAPVRLEPGRRLPITLRLVVADGVRDRAGAEALLAR